MLHKTRLICLECNPLPRVTETWNWALKRTSEVVSVHQPPTQQGLPLGPRAASASRPPWMGATASRTSSGSKEQVPFPPL